MCLPPERFQATIIDSYERPGMWFWQVIDIHAAYGADPVVESGYRTDEQGAETAALSALIRVRASRGISEPES